MFQTELRRKLRIEVSVNCNYLSVKEDKKLLNWTSKTFELCLFLFSGNFRDELRKIGFPKKVNF